MEGLQLPSFGQDPDDIPSHKKARVEVVEPLDVQNFAIHWPKWCDEFQIHVASYSSDTLGDKEKLSILFTCLGAAGSTLASSISAQLQDVAAEADAFDEVWWRMSESWNVTKDVDQDCHRTRDIQDKRRLFLECSADEIAKNQEKWLLLIPHLTLCELEYVAKTVPRLERIVRNYSRIFGVRIEKCCLEKYSLHTDKEVFAKYESISTVTLKDLSESDARDVLAFFKNIQQFSLYNMIILDEISGFPEQLSELTLIDCKIERCVMDKWKSTLMSTLRRLRLHNFKQQFILVPDDYPCYDPYVFRYSAEKLHSLSIKGNEIDFDDQKKVTRLLSITAKTPKNVIKNYHHTHVFLNFDHSPIYALDYFSNLPVKFLATRNWIPLQDIRHLTSLEYLWIMCPVEFKYKEEIDKLDIKTVIVNYQHEPEPSEEPNFIFEMLNEYCLLEITDYLSIPDWMRFGQLHWKVEMALCSYKYTRVVLTEEQIEESGISVDSDYFNYVAQFVTKIYTNDTKKSALWVKFPSASLTSFAIDDTLVEDELHALPVRVEVLHVYESGENFNLQELPLQPYFRKLNSSLRVLQIDWCLGLDGLSELTNLREIHISNAIPIDDVMLVLKQNPQLKCIFILFRNPYSWQLSEEMVKQIGTLEKLEHLGFESSGSIYDEMREESRIFLKQLLETVGPQMSKLTYDLPEIDPLKGLSTNTNIQELHISVIFQVYNIKSILPILCSMRSLTKLKCEFFDNIFGASDLLLLIKSLPCLLKLGLYDSIFEIRFELELREYLRTNNRKLRINKATFP